MSILTYFPSDYQYVRRSAPPPSPKKQLFFLGGGRYTRYSLLIINVLYTKRGKSVPPSIKTLAKKCTCNPDTVKKSICHAFSIAPFCRPFQRREVNGIYNGFTTDLQRIYNGFTTDLQRTCNGLETEVERTYNNWS